MHRPWSRRTVLSGLACTGAAALGRQARGQSPPAPTATETFRILRARAGPLAGGTEGTSIGAYERRVPGPTLRLRQGEDLRLRFANELAQPTAIHWHGVRAPNAMDGVPGLTQASIAPGATFDYVFRPPDAGTFLYHAPWYDVGLTAPDAATPPPARGLYGALIVAEAGELEVDREHILVIDAPASNAPSPIRLVAVGETADARAEPDLMVRANERVRLRLINAALTQVVALRLERHGVHVMAIDGQPSEPFLARDGRVVLGPGNSIDLFVDAALEPGTSTAILLDRAGSDVPLARLVYGKDAPVRAAPLSAPRPLPANPLPAQLDLARAVRIDVPLATLMRPPVQPQEHPPRFTLARGRTVVLAVINPSEVPFAVHVHGHAMRLLDRLDDAWKPFWLHTVVVDAKQSTRVAFAADNPGRWLIECQAIGGRDFVVADWFEIL